MSPIAKIATATLLGTAAVAPAHAAVTFALNDVTFADGATATGSFTTTDDFASITAFSIATTSGTFSLFGIPGFFDSPYAGGSYTPATATASIGADPFLSGDTLVSFSLGEIAGFQFDVPTLQTDTATYSISQGAEFNFIIGRYVSSGNITSASTDGAVPEPVTWAMMLAGFGLLGLGLRARRADALKVRYA